MSFRVVLLPVTLLLASFLGVVYSASFDTDLAYIRKCNHTSPITLRTFNEILINKKLSRPEETDSFKCFMHCLFMMYGWMDEEGGFNLHLMKNELDVAHISVDTIELVLYKCTSTQSVDRCERAYEFLKCFWDTMEEQENAEKQDELNYSIDEAYKRFVGSSRDILMK